jgi:hypothetical protein
MKKQTDKSFLQDIAQMKKSITVQKEDNGVIKPIEYKAVSFNIPKSLFWDLKKYVLFKKSTSKEIFNQAISDFFNNRLSIIMEEQVLSDERQKYNIQIQRDHIENLKKIAIDNRLKLTDIYISIIKSMVYRSV